MKQRTLKTIILVSFIIIICVLGLSIGVLGFYVVKKNIVDRAQQHVAMNLKTARMIYDKELKMIQAAFTLVDRTSNLALLQEKAQLDYLHNVEVHEQNGIKSEIVRAAFAHKAAVSGTRIIDKDELLDLGYGLFTQSQISIHYTPKARPTTQKVLDRAMALEYATPIFDSQGNPESVIYGGKIINKDFELVDKIRNLVFRNELYDDKPVGTVTVFLDDVRIATNVLNEQGERAIGTRVSQEVYENIVGKGMNWIHRAFVVTDWYITAYEPIRDIVGTVIGILYVGEQEKPFTDLTRKILAVLVLLIGLALTFSVIVAFVLADIISRPLRNMLDATCQFYGGDFTFTVKEDGSVKELNYLAKSFNAMAAKLHEREQSLKVSNEKLAELNKSYLDLIGFVAHELKGILSSTVLNAYAVRDGFLGMINFKQRKAMDSVTRNLDYLTATVRNYLDLSRIEKGELTINKQGCLLYEDVFAISVDAFIKQATEREIEIRNEIDPKLSLEADMHLLQIVSNNLVGNAVKYGMVHGLIRITAHETEDGYVRVEVYNDGRPLEDDEREKLFKKFSRLKGPEGKRVQGTGLGLFITKEIIEKHNGTIWVESRKNGNAFLFQIERGI